jgi:AcrR family transcriptional regulator
MLTMEQIVDAVLADGLDKFSMPTIAARLGVAHSGLYRYVQDRDDLVVQVMSTIAKRADWPEVGLPWREQLEQIGESIWRLCDTYPGYAITAVQAKNVSPGFVERLSPYVDSMHEQGLDVYAATAAIEFVRTNVLTSSIDAARLRGIQDEPGTPDHAIPGFADAEKWTGRSWYHRHLNTYLDGLAQQVR